MIIKKFTAKTEELATEEAKRELGPNIVVMNVKPVKKSGFLGLFSPQKIEVTVALEEEQTRQIVADKKTTVKPAANHSAGAAIAQSALNGSIPQLKVTEPEVEKDESTVIEEKLDNLHSLLEQNMIKPEPAIKQAAKVPETKKDEIVKPIKDETDVPDETMSFIKVLYNTLIENEVDEIYANQLTDEIEKISKPGIKLDYTLASVYQKMVLKFGKPETIREVNDDGPIAEIFVGPTGVGKTTTIAKLASELHLTQKKKVALLTIDTYRIAAAEQLRTYASIMEIPFRVVYSAEEMKAAAEDFADYDYIMVDTAGHSIHNKEQMDDIQKFVDTLHELMDCENFLVLSATTKYRDLLEIADAYSKMLSYKLIFTKMDETGATGNLYNVKMHTGAPMSYITNGQNVPNDIAEFDAQRIVKGLLGGSR